LSYDDDLQWHKIILSAIAMRMQPKCYLELGLWYAPAMLELAANCAEMHGVDTLGAVFKVPGNATIHKMTTNEFFSGPGRTVTPPDLVFVDADHRSKQVLTDLYNIEDICSDNCIVLMHDTYPGGTEYTVEGHCADSYLVPGMIPWEHVTLPFPPGVTICRMKPKSLV
jgi:hypothetical protein